MQRVAVQIDDAVAALEERVGRTDARARRVVALIAEDGKEEAAGVGERALLDRLDPAAVHADRNLVLGLAGDRAGVTADAFSEVDGEPVVGHSSGILLYHVKNWPQSHRATERCASRRASHHRPAEPVALIDERPKDNDPAHWFVLRPFVCHAAARQCDALQGQALTPFVSRRQLKLMSRPMRVSSARRIGAERR